MTEDEITDKTEEPSFEVVLEKLGASGKFQLIQIAFCYSSMILTPFIILSFVFLGFEPHHVCNEVNETDLLSTVGLQNDSSAHVLYESCQIKIVANKSGREREVTTMKCPNGRNFFDAKHTTFLSEWDLVCESRGVAEISQLFFNVGQMIGAVVGPFIADRFGRKPAFLSSSTLACFTEFCIIFSPNIFVVYGFKFISGIFYQALMCCFLVFGTEFVLPRHREVNLIVNRLFWVTGLLFVGLVAYIFKDDSWKYFQGGVVVYGLFCLAGPFVLCESPRWLAANGKTAEALHVLKKASDMNGKDFEEIKESFVSYVNYTFSFKKKHLLLMNDNEDCPSEFIIQGREPKEKKPNILSLIRLKVFRRTTLICWYIFLTTILTYYGLFMTSSNISGNRFLNFTLMTLVELPSALCLTYAMKRMKRRLVMKLFLALAALSVLTSTLLATFAKGSDGSGTASTIFFILGKFLITASFNNIFFVISELYPTNLRSTATGFCNGLARIGGIVAPFMRPLYNIIEWAPGLIFTIMCASAVVLASLLPETKDTSLPDTVDDIKRNNDRNSKKRCPTK